MTAMPHDLATKQDAQTIQQTGYRPAVRDTSGRWVLVLVFLILPVLFLVLNLLARL